MKKRATSVQTKLRPKIRPKPLRYILNQIDEFLAVGRSDARKLWSILSALRGPDTGDNIPKFSTTCVVRVEFDCGMPHDPLSLPGLPHFQNHIRVAYEALGLKPDGSGSRHI